MNCLVLEEVELVMVDGDRLGMAANKVHLNSAFSGVVVRAMFKRVDIEITMKFAIDADEKVEIEGRSDAFSIVVGRWSSDGSRSRSPNRDARHDSISREQTP